MSIEQETYIECVNTRDEDFGEILINFKSPTSGPLYRSILITGSMDYFNPTKQISNGTFANLRVEEISITLTKLVTIDADAFYPEVQLTLKELIITKTHLSDPKCFYPLAKLSQLRTLSLSNNKLQIVPEFAFAEMHTNLKILNLAHNEIESIGQNAFSGLVNLELLNLQSNKLSAIAPRIFGIVARKSNVILFLEDNRLHDASFDETFSPVNRIYQIFLENNNFTEIVPQLKPILVPGGHVDLKNVKLTCSCPSIWFISNPKFKSRCENCLCNGNQDAWAFLNINGSQMKC